MADNENDTDEVFYCSGQTYAATRYEPAEYCDEEVDNEGDLCRGHQMEEDGPDPDDARDAWLEMSWEDRYLD